MNGASSAIKVSHGTESEQGLFLNRVFFYYSGRSENPNILQLQGLLYIFYNETVNAVCSQINQY